MTALEQLTVVSLILASPIIAFIITRVIRPKKEGITGKSFLIWLVLTAGLWLIELILVLQSMRPSDPGPTGI